MRMRTWIVAISALMLLSGCSAGPTPPDDDITSITFSQYQAIENFDDSDYIQDDPEQLRRFAELLVEYDVVPGTTITTVEDDCAGGLSSTVTVTYSESPAADMFIATCGIPEFDDFNRQANELLSEWRSDLGGS